MSADPVSILVPNFNGERFIADSLAAMLQAAQAYPGDCEVILVDDASTDRSIEVVAGMDAGIVLVQHLVNRGFSEAVRSGVLAAHHERIILLNSDVRPDREFIAPLIAALADDSVFATTPLVTDAAGEPMFVSWTRYRIVRGKFKAQPWRLKDARARQARGLPLRGLYASGGSMACRKERFLALNGFLDVYKPFYSEDMDLCARAWMRGWETRFIPESRVLHDSNATIGRLFPARSVRTTRLRNRMIFLSLYGAPRRLILSYLPWNLLRALTRLLRLDPTMAMALIQLLRMRREIAALKARIAARQPVRTIEQVLEQINTD